MKYIADFIVRDMTKLPKEKIRREYAPEVKRKILAYFARFEAVMFTTAPTMDVFTGEVVNDANNGYSDGEYTWYSAEIHHFDKYDIKLNDDFIEHVMGAS